MSEQPLTCEGVLETVREMFREIALKNDREREKREAEYARERKEREAEYKQRDKALNKKISDLGSRIGQIIEHMIGGNIIEKFRAFGYDIIQYGRNISYEYKKLNISGEIDMFLEDGDVAILIEVKTSLETADVREHIKQLEEYRLIADARGDKRRFVGAVAGAVIAKDAIKFAHENGLYVIVQSGEAVEILPVPENFQAKQW